LNQSPTRHPPRSCHFNPTRTAIHPTTSPPPHHIAVVPISRAIAGPCHRALHHLTTIPPHQAATVPYFPRWTATPPMLQLARRAEWRRASAGHTFRAPPPGSQPPAPPLTGSPPFTAHQREGLCVPRVQAQWGRSAAHRAHSVRNDITKLPALQVILLI
jgi:hypothetical protein